MKRIILSLALFFAVSASLHAQQNARYSQYLFNKQVLNAAYTGNAHDGMYRVFSATALLRQQWVQIDGAPRTASLSLHTPLGANSGVGGFLEYDEIGVHRGISLFGSYSYRFMLGNDLALSIGVQGGAYYLSSQFSTLTGNEQIQVTVDPDLLQDQARLMPNFGLGLYLYKNNKFYVGLSAPHLLANQLRNPIVGIAVAPVKERHYNAMAGGVISLSNNAFKIVPSALVKVVPGQAPIQTDLTLMFLLKDFFWFGGSYRAGLNNKNAFAISESVDFIVAFNLKNGLRIGYAYDYTLSSLNTVTTGSHEIMLGFTKPGSKGKRIVDPRYFQQHF